MGVMHSLLYHSVLDPAVQRVILLSGDAVPLKSFSTLYTDLMLRNASSLCLCQKRFWGISPGLEQGEYMAAKAHTWFALTRADAKLVVGRRALWKKWRVDTQHRAMNFRGGDDEYVIAR